MQKNIPECLICRSKVSLYLRGEKYLIYRCPNCGLGRTVGIGSQKGNYHRDEYYQSSEKQFANIFTRRVNLIKRYFPQPGRVLEIGSSTGVMLSLLKKIGWEVVGIEPSQVSADVSSKKGIKTVIGYFEKIKLADQSFDLVILNHTLEHMTSPIDVLQKVKRILRSDGVLFIDVPNFSSLSVSIYKNKWPYLLPQEHLWHFTDKAFKRILPQLGFKIFKFSCPSGIWDYGNPWLELWQSFSTFKKRFFSNLLTLIPSLMVTVLGKGTGLTVIARKE